MAGTRPKGYMEDWNPKPEVAEIVRLSLGILREYGQYGPMTVRQIFYRLVGQHGYPKEEKAYKRLAEYLVKARRAQMVSFTQIRDDGGKTGGGAYGFESVDDFLKDLEEYSTSHTLNPTLGQPHNILIYCEAEGMVPMLAQMTREYGVLVTGTGGFSSVTVTHSIAQDVLRNGKPTIFLHVGDYDPSGESIYESTCQDIGKFVAQTLGAVYNTQTGETLEVDGEVFEWGCDGSFFIPRRVAVTPEQVMEYNLPSEPPKASDSRTLNWDGLAATQAEAMAPSDLDGVITSAVEEWVDMGKLAEIHERQDLERELIGDRVKDAIAAVREQLEDEDQ